MECEACFLQMVIEQGWNIDKVHEQSMCIIKSLHPICNVLLVFVVGQIESLEENYTPHSWRRISCNQPKMQRVLLSSQVFGKKLLFLTAPFGGYIYQSNIVGDSTMSYKIEVVYWKELPNVECLSVQSQTRFPQHDWVQEFCVGVWGILWWENCFCPTWRKV
jgi:hypothetical protein